MWRSMVKTAAATAGYGLVHSLLADARFKRSVAALIGDRHYHGLYRAFYQVQSFATLAALIAYVRTLPNTEIYHVKGPMGVAMKAGQATALGLAGWTMVEAGLGRFTGIENLAALAAGRSSIPEAAEGHGPIPDDDGSIRAEGPFRLTRHPAHLAFPLLTWLNPRMTTNLLAYNVIATAYFVIGAAREEARIEAGHRLAYERYRATGVPFYLPAPLADRPDPT